MADEDVVPPFDLRDFLAQARKLLAEVDQFCAAVDEYPRGQARPQTDVLEMSAMVDALVANAEGLRTAVDGVYADALRAKKMLDDRKEA